MAPQQQLETTLRSTRRRVTEQRRLLLEIIRTHGEHLDADQIYALAREQNPRLSLSTVYRTLGLLRNLGFVDEVHLGEDHHHYELKSAAAHHHLVCRSCGRVTEFSTLLADELAASVGDEYGYDVQEVRIDLAGLCSPCREEQESGGTTPRGAPRGMSVVAGESAPQGHAAGTRCYSVHCSPGKPGWSPAWQGVLGSGGSWRASVLPRGLSSRCCRPGPTDR